VIHTTKAIEALNRQLRKAIKTKGSFPSEEAAIKLLHLATQNAVRNGQEAEAGRKRCSRPRSNSETASPTDTNNRLHS
jgi:transposase-like protein